MDQKLKLYKFKAGVIDTLDRLFGAADPGLSRATDNERLRQVLLAVCRNPGAILDLPKQDLEGLRGIDVMLLADALGVTGEMAASFIDSVQSELGRRLGMEAVYASLTGKT